LYSQIDDINARIKDVERGKGVTSILNSMLYSGENGRQMLRQFYVLGSQGESAALAMKRASELSAYHEPDGVMDKYLNAGANTFWPMFAVIASAGVPGIGSGLAMAAMGTPMGTDTYLDLRQREVARPESVLAASAVGVGGAAIEAFTGPLAGKVLGGTGNRVARLKYLSRAMSAGDDAATGIIKGIKTGRLNLKSANEAMKAYFGSDTSKLQALVRMGKEQATETLTGGIEEWLQQGIQIGLSEAALANEGLDSL
ncbi:unnamed protein product, partial [marine sediment metagenome]